jgi:uncharacterized membrane protein YgcG
MFKGRSFVALFVVVMLVLSGASSALTVSAQEPTEQPTEQPTEEPECLHPVAEMIAAFYDVETSEIMDWHDQGVGFGVIAMAYYASTLVEGMTAEDLINMKLDGMGWGNVMKEIGLAPGQAASEGSVGKTRQKSKAGEGDEAGDEVLGPQDKGPKFEDSAPGQAKKQNQELEQNQNQNQGQGQDKEKEKEQNQNAGQGQGQGKDKGEGLTNLGPDNSGGGGNGGGGGKGGDKGGGKGGGGGKGKGK